MPIPLLPLIAGGSAVAGLLGGLLSPSGRFRSRDVTPDLRALQAQIANLQDPNFGLQQLMRLAQASVPGQDDFFQRLHALGGSALEANVQFEQARASANEQALMQQGSNFLGAQQQALGGLSNIAQLQQQGMLAAAQSRQRAAENQGAFFNQLLGGGLGILAGGSQTGFGVSPREQAGGIFGGMQTPQFALPFAPQINISDPFSPFGTTFQGRLRAS